MLVDLMYAFFELAWLAFFGLFFVALWRHVRGRPRAEVVVPAVLFVLALALHLVFATWGPGDGNIIYDVVLHQRFLWDPARGSIPDALWMSLFHVLPVRDLTIVTVLLLLGAVAPALLVVALRELGATATASLAAGTLLATNPLFVRFSGEGSRVALVAFLAVASLWFLGRLRRTGATFDGVLFTLSATLCCWTRPEAGVMFVPWTLALLLSSPVGAAHRWRVVVALAIAGLASVANVVAIAVTSGVSRSNLRLLLDLKEWFDPAAWFWLSPGSMSQVAVALALLALVAVVRNREPRLAAWAIGSLVLAGALAGCLGDTEANGRLQFANSRYHVVSFLVFAIAGGLGAGELTDRLEAWRGRALARAVLVLVGVALAATSIQPLRDVCEPRTIDHEYRFLRRAVHELPADAIVYYVASYGRLGGLVNPERTPETRGPLEWRKWPPEQPLIDPVRPRYVYLSPKCYKDRTEPSEAALAVSQAINRHCDEAERAARPDGALTVEIPARHWGYERYATDRMRIGFYPLAAP